MIAKNIVITREAENIENAKKNASAAFASDSYKKNEVIPYTLLHSYKHLAIVNVNTEKFALQDSKRMMPYLSFNFMHAAATGFRIFHRHGIIWQAMTTTADYRWKKWDIHLSKVNAYHTPCLKNKLSLPSLMQLCKRRYLHPIQTSFLAACIACYKKRCSGF